MVKKFGKFPANARVDVDYSKKKPKIKFSYPKNGKSGKQQAHKQHLEGYHSLVLMLIFTFLFYVLIGNTPVIFLEKEYPTNCVVSLDEQYINMSWYTDINGNNATTNTYRKWITGANFTCDNGLYEVRFDKENNPIVRAGFYRKPNLYSSLVIMAYFFSVFYLYFLGFVITNKLVTKLLLKSKRYRKWFPAAQAKGLFGSAKKRYVKFKPEDVENNIVEIPYFKNVELDYKTEGDFDKQLERVKIHEHQYNNYRKGKVGKKQVKVYEWYARFYFKNKPKDGYLEVIYQ